MLCEASIVLLLVAPMPSNQVRGAIVGAITSIWDKSPAVRYIAIGLNAINLFYFWHVCGLMNGYRICLPDYSVTVQVGIVRAVVKILFCHYLLHPLLDLICCDFLDAL